MRATIEGLVTHTEKAEKGERKFTEVLLMQKGIRTQVRVRLDGHEHEYDEFERAEFTGEVMAWGKRSGEADFMLMVR